MGTIVEVVLGDVVEAGDDVAEAVRARCPESLIAISGGERFVAEEAAEIIRGRLAANPLLLPSAVRVLDTQTGWIGRGRDSYRGDDPRSWAGSWTGELQWSRQSCIRLSPPDNPFDAVKYPVAAEAMARAVVELHWARSIGDDWRHLAEWLLRNRERLPSFTQLLIGRVSAAARRLGSPVRPQMVAGLAGTGVPDDDFGGPAPTAVSPTEPAKPVASVGSAEAQAVWDEVQKTASDPKFVAALEAACSNLPAGSPWRLLPTAVAVATPAGGCVWSRVAEAAAWLAASRHDTPERRDAAAASLPWRSLALVELCCQLTGDQVGAAVAAEALRSQLAGAPTE